MKDIEFNIKNYIKEHHNVMESLDTVSVQRAIDLIIKKALEGKHIFTCGNGGSASTASHYVTDWNKMANLSNSKPFRGVCLSDNMGLVTAFGNDLSYDDIFSGQLKSLASKGDVLVAVSGSGNSKNVINAINLAKDLDVSVIGVLGYDGGLAKDLCDEVCHVPSWDMQIAEDIHLTFGHLVMKAICKENIKPKHID